MKKILAKAKREGWTYLEQSLACGNRMVFEKNEKRIGITLNPAAYQMTNMSSIQMNNVMAADALYTNNEPIVEKIRTLSFEEQTNLIGVEREIFLLICEEPE